MSESESSWPISQQVRDYCDRFGQSRELLQYLRGKPHHQPFQTDIPKASLKNDAFLNDHPKIVKEKSESTKTIQKPEIQMSSSKENKAPNKHDSVRVHFLSSSHFNLNKISPRSNESSTEILNDYNDDDAQNVDSFTNKGSPESSITSRKLEWDSLADIGYENLNQDQISSDKPLSTLERITLERHYKLDEFNKPTKNKRTTGIKTKNTFSLGSPFAQSTPLASENKSEIKDLPSCKKKGKKTGIRTKNNFSDLNITKNINLNIDFKHPSDVPDINEENSNNNNTVSNPKSVEVSSENKEAQTSIIKNACTSSQTTRRSSDEGWSTIRNLDGDIPKILAKGPVIFNVVRSDKKRTKYVVKRKPPTFSFGKSPSKNLHRESDKSAARLHKKETDIKSNTPDVILSPKANESPVKYDDENLIRADSFEFMPGSAFDESICNLEDDKISLDLDKNADDLQSYRESSEITDKGSTRCNTISSGVSKTSLKLESSCDYCESVARSSHRSDIKDLSPKFETPDSLSRDLKSSFAQTDKLVDLGQGDPIYKNELIQTTVKTLISADYSDDGIPNLNNNAYEISPAVKIDEACQTDFNVEPVDEKKGNKCENLRCKNTKLKEEPIKKNVLINTDYSDGERSSKNSLKRKNSNDLLTEEGGITITANVECQTETGVEGRNVAEIISIDNDKSIKKTTDKILSKDQHSRQNSKSDSCINSTVSKETILNQKEPNIKTCAERNSFNAKKILSSINVNELDYSTLGNNSIDTQRKLNAIDKEITNLLMLKLKLETRSKNTRSAETTTSLSNNVSSSYGNADTASGIYIPALNLQSSSSCDDTSAKLQTDFSAQEKDLTNKNAPSNSNNKQLQSNSLSRPTKSTSNSNKSNKEISASVKIPCKCSSKNSAPSLCPCCTSNLISSSSSVTETEEVSAEIKKINKIYAKYQNCKVMKSFMKEYEALVTKYKTMKILKSQNSVNDVLTHGSQISHSKSENVDSLSKESYQTLISKSDCINSNRKGKNEDSESLVMSTSKRFDHTPNSIAPIHATENNWEDTPSSIAPMRFSDKDPKSNSQSSQKSIPNRKAQSSQVTGSLRSHKSPTMETELLKQMSFMLKNIENHLSKLNPQAFPERSSAKVESDTDKSDKSSKKDKTKLKIKKCTCVRLDALPKSDQNEESASKSDVSIENNVCNKCDKCCKCRPCRKKYTRAQIEQYKKEYTPQKTHRKPVAYNLILQPSDSILEESSFKPIRRPLDKIIAKVPKRGRNSAHPKNDKRALHDDHFRIAQKDENEESTDEQLKEFSSLNDDNSSSGKLDMNGESAEYYKREVPNRNELILDNTTLEEYLRRNRPTFVDKVDRRQEIMKEINKSRNERDKERRKLLELGLPDFVNMKELSLSEMQKIIKLTPSEWPSTANNRVFNAREIIRNTARQYYKLPEVREKMQLKKKEDIKKTNRVMAEIFVKRLRQKTLKGCVNIPHDFNIISL